MCAALQEKVDQLNDLHQKTREQLEGRQNNLEYTLGVAEKFWENFDNTIHALKDLLETASCQEPPALDTSALQAQQDQIEVHQLQLTMITVY